MKDDVPKYQEIMWPTLKVLEQKGGSATNAELVEATAFLMELPEEVLEVTHNDGPMSLFEYRAAWARSYLKMIGAVENSERGVWAITEVGQNLPDAAATIDLAKKTKSKIIARRRRATKLEQDAQSVELVSVMSDPMDGDWRTELLSQLKSMSPSGFERLCQRLLREAGFSKVNVTGKSGDGGIDGEGVLRINLLSFHVRFQCKRYAESVGSPAIRDFRGAMVGRADKGLFITTGRFTREAEAEAVRDGATAIDLIDGNELCDLLQRYGLGVETTMLEKVAVKSSFFKNL